jgi:Ca-activated chloride channel family protein
MEFLASFDSSLFHFLRPQWLWALVGLLPLAWWLWQGGHTAGAWKQWVDPQLQPHVLTQGKAERRWFKRLWLLLVWLLAVLALAGPTWEQRPTPLLRSEQARIVVLDLSRSMLANDMRPSRLELARLKVRDLLQQSRDSKAGLVAFAAQAFAIAPLTDDIQTLLSQVPSLHPDLMPAQGGRVDRALLQALEMLKNGGAGGGGQILLVTDSRPQEAAFAAAQTLRDMGYELSVLAVGTEQGAPIPEDTRRGRGFVKDRSGNIVIATLPTSELRQLALSGGGQFSLLTADDSDIKKLSKVLEREQAKDSDSTDSAQAGDQWLEAGPYLLLLLLPLAALGFRRGWLLAAVLVIGLPSSPPALAASGVGSALWFNADQRGKQALESGQAEQALELFESPDWKAAAQYRAGQHQAASDYWQQQQNPAASYNQGNALAHAGDLQAALQAWQQVPEQHELYASAQHNIEVIKPLLEQQQQNSEQQQDGQQQESEQENNDSEQSQQDQQSQNSPQEGEQGQPQEQESSSQQSDSQQSDAQSDQNQQQPSAESEQEAEQNNESAQQQAESQAEGQAAEAAEDANDEAAQPQLSAEELAQEQAEDQVIEQWLNRIADDPGGLLREKFKRDYKRRQQQRGGNYSDEEQAW